MLNASLFDPNKKYKFDISKLPTKADGTPDTEQMTKFEKEEFLKHLSKSEKKRRSQIKEQTKPKTTTQQTQHQETEPQKRTPSPSQEKSTKQR